MKIVMHVIGARPNYMKVAPIVSEMAKYPDEFKQIIVHTGQHYDANMSQVFFDELGLPTPDVNLNVGSGTHAWQTAQIMQNIEPIILEYRPDWIIVPGDVNSTLACALVAQKLGVRIAHLEAGLRSFDRTMPEEINRILTDHLADMLFSTEQSGNINLKREGILDDKIFFVGNTMIDTLVRLLPKTDIRWPILRQNIAMDRYILVTLHRPANVDEAKTLRKILFALKKISHDVPIVFPVHPRTRKRINEVDPKFSNSKVLLLNPLGYLDFLALQAHAQVVLTDSGGIQEETTYLRIPCLTIRPNTERPVTITHGTNRLVKCDDISLREAVSDAIGEWKRFRTSPLDPPKYWDGNAAIRIVRVFRCDVG